MITNIDEVLAKLFKRLGKGNSDNPPQSNPPKNSPPQPKTPKRESTPPRAKRRVRATRKSSQEREAGEEAKQRKADKFRAAVEKDADATVDQEVNEDEVEKVGEEYKLAKASEWAREFPWDSEVIEANRMVFQHESFKGQQLEIINAAKSSRDVVGLMPTGGGKSLTFQLPAITDGGVTIVIMPLISLIEDQIGYLKSLGIHAIFFKRGMVRKTFYKELQEESKIKLIYMTPEKIVRTESFQVLLKELYSDRRISRFVIDEAHCVSQWGKDFRSDYLDLNILRLNYPRVPILALTATATKIVKEDIIHHLMMRDPVLIQGGFNRKNLYYAVREKPQGAKLQKEIVDYIVANHKDETGIIYCNAKKDCESLTDYLSENSDISCDFYHSDVTEEKKKAVQKSWMDGETKVIVATTAFGLGINKDNVRFVIHHSMPKAMEDYIQECGRAGRDGKRSCCLMFYSLKDKRTHEYFFLQGKKKNPNEEKVKQHGQANMYKIIDYCKEKYICRRKIQLEYLGEEFSSKYCNDMCDNCKLRGKQGTYQSYQEEAKKIYTLIQDIEMGGGKPLTIIQAADLLHGKKATKPHVEGFYDIFRGISKNKIIDIILKLLLNRVLREDVQQVYKSVTAYLGMGSRSDLMLRGQLNIRMTVNQPSEVAKEQEVKEEVKTKKLVECKKVMYKKVLEMNTEELVSRLIYLRDRMQASNRTNKNLVASLFSTKKLLKISKMMPSNMEELKFIIGDTDSSQETLETVKKYGNNILAEIKHYKELCARRIEEADQKMEVEEVLADDEDTLEVEDIIKESNFGLIGNTGAQFNCVALKRKPKKAIRPNRKRLP